MNLSPQFQRALEAEVRRLVESRWIHTARAVPGRGSSNRQASKASAALARRLGRGRAKLHGRLVVFLQPVDQSGVNATIQDIELQYGVTFQMKYGQAAR